MVLVIAAAYCITGKLGLLLAIPPGYATAIWPPSGIALAATLMYGYRVWPGTVLGSVLVNIGTALETASVAALLKSVALATSIGMGAALQAVVGAYLVRRGKIPWALTPLSWWTWWVGDTIGVLIVTPLVLSWVAEPRQPWRRRRLSVTLALVGAFALAVIFFVHTSGRERERVRLIFERQTETIARTLQDRLNDYLGVLYAIKSFFTSTPGVTRQEFHTFVQGALVRHPGLQALSFDRRVSMSLPVPSAWKPYMVHGIRGSQGLPAGSCWCRRPGSNSDGSLSYRSTVMDSRTPQSRNAASTSTVISLAFSGLVT